MEENKDRVEELRRWWKSAMRSQTYAHPTYSQRLGDVCQRPIHGQFVDVVACIANIRRKAEQPVSRGGSFPVSSAPLAIEGGGGTRYQFEASEGEAALGERTVRPFELLVWDGTGPRIPLPDSYPHPPAEYYPNCSFPYRMGTLLPVAFVCHHEAVQQFALQKGDDRHTVAGACRLSLLASQMFG